MAPRLFLLAMILLVADRYGGIAGATGAPAATGAAPSSASPSGATDPAEPRLADWNGRRKRGYARWAYPSEQFQGFSFSYFKPQSSDISRPYFIPVYGVAGKAPIYFPPQPIYVNPGIPPDNPVRPFMGPTYLPPKEAPLTTTQRATTKKPKITDRNYDDEDEEERPRWGIVQNGESGNGAVPTRLPRPSDLQEFPPLLHDVNGGTNKLAANGPRAPPAPPSTRAPRPTTTTTTAAPRRPAADAAPAGIPSGPSNCVWAVISCCSASSDSYPESCFEQRGCPGPFWDRSPCESDFAKAAIDAALHYYS